MTSQVKIYGKQTRNCFQFCGILKFQAKRITFQTYFLFFFLVCRKPTRGATCTCVQALYMFVMVYTGIHKNLFPDLPFPKWPIKC
jgi:hypothetical protein